MLPGSLLEDPEPEERKRQYAAMARAIHREKDLRPELVMKYNLSNDKERLRGTYF